MNSKGKGLEGQPSKARRRKGDTNPVRHPPITGPLLRWTCTNSACRAEHSINDLFCPRCSCCICSSYDVNKDPSLWLECTRDSPAASCGKSCHIKCAIRLGKVHGSYRCASCNQISGILGCWKKQLIMAMDSQSVGDLCYRIDLSFRLFDGTSRFQDLHEIVKEAKNKLETEVGPLGGVSANLEVGHGLANRLVVAAEVKKLCIAAVRKADEISTASLDGEGPVMSGLVQMVNPNTSKEMVLKFICPDLNIDISQNDSNEEVAEGNDCDSAVVHDGNVEYNFKNCVMMIRRLECEKHFTSEVRLKLVTWLSVKSNERECRALNALIDTFGDDYISLAAQLKHTFAHVINAN